MKYRVTDIVMLLLSVALLFCSCAPAPAAEAAAAPTEPLFHTESETLYHADQITLRQNMELVYDADGNLTQERRRQYDGSGHLSYLTVTKFDETGAAAAYSETHYNPSGSLSSSLRKDYENGILCRQAEIRYFPNGNARSVEEWVYSSEGILQKWHLRSYNAVGDRLSDMRDQLDPKTGFMTISGESRYENGSLEIRRSGFRHGDGSLLDGKIEIFDENGNLIRLEEAVWIKESRSSIFSVAEYDTSGNVLFSQQALQYRDEQGRITALDETLYEQNMSFASHRVENRSFDSAGQISGKTLQYFLSDGTPAEQYEYRYEYNENALLLREEKLHRLDPEKPQEMTVTEYAYHEDGSLLSQTQTGFDADRSQTFQTVKKYDVFGKLEEFVTVSNLGNCYTYSYGYNEEGTVCSELLTTRYRSGTRIDYQETAWEYHENGKYKTVSVHKWTSHDEAKNPDAAPGDLGQTTVTEYDEEGNKM